MLWRIEASLMFHGAAYGAKLDVNMQTMRWFNSATIYPVWLPLQGLTGFRRASPGQTFFDLASMWYVWYPSPFSELGPGPGAARVASDEAGVVRGVNKALSAYFDRGMIQPILVYDESTGGPSFTPDQKTDLKAWLSRTFQGVKRAFVMEISTRKLGKLDLSSSLKDAYPPGIRDEMCHSIAKTLGIPMSLLFSDAANKATAEQEEINLHEQTTIPECNLIEEAHNSQVFQYFGFEMHFTPKELPCFQGNSGIRAQGMAGLVSSGMPVDIATEEMGYELDEEASARIKLIALMKEGSSYDDASKYIIDDCDPLEVDRVKKVLALFKPAPQPVTPIQQLYNAPQAPAPPGQATEQAAQVPPGQKPVEQQVPPQPLTKGDNVRLFASTDLQRWQTKSIKRVKAGKPASCEFDSDEIDPALAGAIAGALESATTADEVKSIFSQCERWQGYP